MKKDLKTVNKTNETQAAAFHAQLTRMEATFDEFLRSLQTERQAREAGKMELQAVKTELQAVKMELQTENRELARRLDAIEVRRSRTQSAQGRSCPRWTEGSSRRSSRNLDTVQLARGSSLRDPSADRAL
eukprot:m.160676 g.160676  ORF g.160676 m.160676 type:complete len:130 (+) comp9851_c0_seq8:2276-2665(+)